ncbi:hypothetical protein SESBI_10534 [Sesbania bispinosa]|nr:hypothetical protein SESBI_10534 [Sesbania bispinosa]
MRPEAVLKLFDSFWLELNVLKENSNSSTSSVENIDYEIKESSELPKLTRIRTNHTRSMSDQSMTSSFNHNSHSPDSVLLPSKLQTILSGKEATDSEAETPAEVKHEDEVLLPKQKNITSSGRRKRESKSLSDLEFEELKGFMDLGFVFSEEDKNSSLASIIPGLQRLGKKEEEAEEEDGYDESVVPRPYLSEAWEVHDRRKKENPLMNWRVPALNNETDMKDSLRLWAHTVASTVR